MDYLPLLVCHLNHRGVQRIEHADLQERRPLGPHHAPCRFPAGRHRAGVALPPHQIRVVPVVSHLAAARSRGVPHPAAGLRQPAHRQHPGHREDQRGGPLGEILRRSLPAVGVCQDGTHYLHGLPPVPGTNHGGGRPERLQAHPMGGGADVCLHPARKLLHGRVVVRRDILDDVCGQNPNTQAADLGRKPGGSSGVVRRLPLHHAQRDAGEDSPGPPFHHGEKPYRRLHQRRQGAPRQV